MLNPAGASALHTPNGRARRLQRAEFIDPDQKVEYTVAKLVAPEFRLGQTWA